MQFQERGAKVSGQLKPLLVIPLLAVMAGGCAAVAVGVGAGAGIATYRYVMGELKLTMPWDVTTLYNASQATLEQDLKVRIEEKNADATFGLIIARRADGAKVTVKMKLTNPNVTTLYVRAGRWGDKNWSLIFVEKLKARL